MYYLQQKEANMACINNVYIKMPENGKLMALTKEGWKDYLVSGEDYDASYQGIADLYIDQNRVGKIVYKPANVMEEIFAISEEGIQLDCYGKLPFDECYRCYKMGDDVENSTMESLYVGQKNVSFVVAEGKICAIIFAAGEERAKEENIRVILKDDKDGDYDHLKICVAGTEGMVVEQGGERKEYGKEEKCEITREEIGNKHIKISSCNGGKIRLLSSEKACGTPEYRGTFEVVSGENGVRIINEVSLEEYLYGVVPSEMPAEYAKEALKAQAICARSYAIKHKKNNRLKAMGANVDDSSSYQVYNNLSEQETSNQAVDETKGLCAMYEGEIASTYFYATSCGCSTSAKDGGFSGKEVPYLKGELQERERGADQLQNDQYVSGMLGNEELFQKYLTEDRDVLDKSQPWYRWNASLTKKGIQANLEEKLKERCKAVPTQIRVKQSDGRFKTQEIEKIGDVKKISIIERKRGGVVSCAEIEGTEATIRIYREYNIRTLLYDKQTKIKRQDGSEVAGEKMNLLPSGFFMVQDEAEQINLKGGGFGHGIGMSQTAANELAQAGKSSEEILKYFYSGISIDTVLSDADGNID